MKGLGIRVLGPIRLVTSDGSETPVRGRAGHLLATLALQPGRVWSPEALAERLWHDHGPPPTARTALHGYVSRLRRMLANIDGVHLETIGSSYTLRAAREVIDACRFTDLLAEARDGLAAGAAASAADKLTEALAIWPGDAPTGAGIGGPPAADLRALIESRRDAEEHLVDALIEAGDLPTALTLAGRLVTDDPLRERRWVQLVVGLARSGRQADALRACRQAADVIVERTGLDPGPELRRLEMAVLVQDPELDVGRWAPAPGSAPVPLVALSGRDDERAVLADRLRTSRMVTLVGPGGVGKSTLAVAAAAAEATQHADGAVVVELGGVGQHDVGRALAAALGASGPAGPRPEGVGDEAADPLARAVAIISRRDVLIVLDDCTQVGDAAGDAAIELLGAGPGVRVLATGTAALGVPGESVLRLHPLAVPPPGAEVDLIRRTPASELLGRRLDELGCPVVDDDGWRAVAEIARTLEGMPLALEITAAMARTEPLGSLVEHLADDAAALLDVEAPRPGQRRSLRTALDAATERLSPEAAELFATLTVLPGSFDAQLAAAAAGTDVATARAALRSLVDASLVALDEARTRGHLLLPIRAYAGTRLAPAAQAAAHDRLIAWCLDLAADLDAGHGGPGQLKAIERFVAELPTLRAGLRHLLDTGRVTEAAALFADLVSCWIDSPASSEVSTWAGELLSHADQLSPGSRARLGVDAVRSQISFDGIAAGLSTAERALVEAEASGEAMIASAARILIAIGLGWRGEGIDRASRLLEEARTEMVALGERRQAAVALEFQGLLDLRQLDVAAGVARLEAALTEHRAVGRPVDIAHTLTFIGFARRVLADLAGARRAFDEARRLLGSTRVSTWLRATAGAGYAALALDDVDDATTIFRVAHARANEVGDRRMVSTALVGLAATARAQGDVQRSVALLLAAVDQGLAGGDPADAVTAATGLARLLADQGHDDDAALLLGAADALPTSAGVRVHFGLAEDPTPLLAVLDDRMGREQREALAADGALIGMIAATQRAATHLVDDTPVLAAEGDLRLVG